MSGGWGHALAAAVGGWQAGARTIDDKKDKDEERQWRNEQREAARQDLKDRQSEKQALREAGRPLAMTEGAGGMVAPTTMDNRDVGLPENAVLPNQGLQSGGYAVAGQSFADRGAAQAELARQNAPEAVNQRVAQVYRSQGAPDKAMAMESAARTAEVQNMQLADQRWKRDLGKAMRGGHSGLAQLATTSEAGPMAGLKVQAVTSPDGKSVTYSSLDKDGKANPIPGLPVFSNDEKGLTQAAWMLDQSIDPAARMAHFTAEKNREEDRGDKRETREETRRHNMAMEGLTSRSIGVRESAGSGGGKGKGAGEAPSFDPLNDFDPKQARKEAMELAGKEAEAAGKPYSEQRAQAIYGKLRDAAAADNTNRHVQSVVSKELRSAQSDPATYAETFAKASKVANIEQLAAWGFKPPGATAGSKPASPGSAASAPVAAASRPAAPPATTAAPANDAGARLDAARQNLAALRSKPAPGLAAGRAAIDERAAQVQAARQALAEAEAEYQRAVPQSGAAFVTAR